MQTFRNTFGNRPLRNVFNKRPRSDSAREGSDSPALSRRRHAEPKVVQQTQEAEPSTSFLPQLSSPPLELREDLPMPSPRIPSPDPRPPSPLPPSPSPPLPPPPLRRRQPARRAREALANVLPEGPRGLNTASDEEDGSASNPPARASYLPRVILHVHERIRTLPNKFRLVREYRRRPHVSVPDQQTTFEDHVDAPKPQIRTARRSIKQIIFPYPSITAFLLGYWQNKGSNSKTLDEFDKLQKVMDDPRYVPRDATGFSLRKIYRKLADDVQAPLVEENDGVHKRGGWRKHPVTINVPTGIKATKEVRRERAREASSARRQGEEYDPHARLQFTVPDVHTRSLVDIMRSAVEENPASRGFHWHPFTEYWTPPYADAPVQEVMGELYASEAFRQAEKDLLASPPEPGCDLPRVVFSE
ncbi:hypothetical protein GGF50DRAFT_93231, partial [Schizophyllum commune]